MEGYFYGILDIYYAPMTTEETSTTAPTYDTPKVLAKSILSRASSSTEIIIMPTYKEKNTIVPWTTESETGF